MDEVPELGGVHLRGGVVRRPGLEFAADVKTVGARQVFAEGRDRGGRDRPGDDGRREDHCRSVAGGVVPAVAAVGWV